MTNPMFTLCPFVWVIWLHLLKSCNFMDLSCRMCIENTTSLPQIFYCSHTCYCITQLGLWCSAGKSTPKSDLSQSKDIVQYVFFFF